MPRLFVAIDLPAAVKTALVAFAPELPVARWVGREEIHLTLRFLGDTPLESCTAIRSALSGIRFDTFPITLHGVGHFPPGRHPRVLWVGMEPCSGLALLHRELELALAETGNPADERGFSPHVTLARLKETPPAAVVRFEARHGALAFPPFAVREFVLYSSVLTRHGAIHGREAVYPGSDPPLPPAAE